MELPIRADASLVDCNFVRLCRRITPDEIQRLMDYELVWVWDIGKPGSRYRELRFWLPCVVTPQMCARLTLNEVLSRLLPESRQTLWSAEVAQLLLMDRNAVSRLARRLDAGLVNRTWQFKREALTRFLTERYIGGMP